MGIFFQKSLSSSFVYTHYLRQHLPCSRGIYAISRRILPLKCVAQPFIAKVAPMSSLSQESTKKTNGMLRIFWGAGLLAIPFFARALNSETQKSGMATHEDGLTKVVAPITENIIRLVRLHRIGLKGKSPIVIGISGCTGAGKSTFAEELKMILQGKGVKAEILHGDDFLNPIPPQHALAIHPHFDQILAHRVMKQLLACEKIIEKPAYVWDARAGKRVVKPVILDTSGVEVWLFECQYSAFDENTYDLHKYAAFQILLNPSTELATKWVWKRNRGIPKGTNKEKYVAEVASSIERYKNYLKPVHGKIKYILEPDAQHNLVLTANVDHSKNALNCLLWG